MTRTEFLARMNASANWQESSIVFADAIGLTDEPPKPEHSLEKHTKEAEFARRVIEGIAQKVAKTTTFSQLNRDAIFVNDVMTIIGDMHRWIDRKEASDLSEKSKPAQPSATRCPVSFPHPPHDSCDGNPGAPPFGAILAEPPRKCLHENLDMDGVCRSCGADCRGIPEHSKPAAGEDIGARIAGEITVISKTGTTLIHASDFRDNIGVNANTHATRAMLAFVINHGIAEARKAWEADVAKAVAEEREACARTADGTGFYETANLIRNRTAEAGKGAK